jgi:adenine deaminase
LKLVVVNRYQPAVPAVAFVRGFGLRVGAIASSVAHDCHNVVAVGASDAALVEGVNRVIAGGGGIAVVGDGLPGELLRLPVAGLMSDDYAELVAASYQRLTARAKELGSPLTAPFMTLSFMALLVIPKLKLSDRGLFDCERFGLVPLFEPAAD